MIVGKDIYVDDGIVEKLELFYELHKNATLNLTNIKDRDEFYCKHYLDSVYLFHLSEVAKSVRYFKASDKLADVGSGGGFPGIVIAICYPEMKVTLIESTRKKCDFLKEAIAELDLKNVTVINDRVENLEGFKFSYITARGVAKVDKLLKHTENVLAKKFKIILYKGEMLEEELKDASDTINHRGLDIEITRIEEMFKRSYCIISGDLSK